jgi:transposase
MTEHTRKQYTAEFKREAVELVTKQGYTVAEAARSLDTHGQTRGSWLLKLRLDETVLTFV